MSDRFCPAGKIECDNHFIDNGHWCGPFDLTGNAIENCPWFSRQKPVQHKNKKMTKAQATINGWIGEQIEDWIIGKTDEELTEVAIRIYYAGYEQCRKDIEKEVFMEGQQYEIDCESGNAGNIKEAISRLRIKITAAIRAVKMEVRK